MKRAAIAKETAIVTKDFKEFDFLVCCKIKGVSEEN
jgi:hypothetical protein